MPPDTPALPPEDHVEPLTALLTLTGHRDDVSRLAWAPDGTRLASASWDTTARIWDGASGRPLLVLSGHEQGVTSLAWSPDGAFLATAGDDDMIRMWHAGNGEPLWTRNANSRYVTSLSWSSANGLLSAAGTTGDVTIWEPITGDHIRTIAAHSLHLTDVAWSPNGRCFATSSDDHSVRIWESFRRVSELVHPDKVTSVSWSPDDSLLVTGCWDGTVRVWDAHSGQLKAKLFGHTAITDDVLFAAPMSWIIARSNDSTVRVWDAMSLAPIAQIDVPSTTRYSGIALAEASQLLATTAPPSGSIKIWQLAVGERRQEEGGVRYSNAKIVLLGATGEGKTSLAHALVKRPFVTPGATFGRHVYQLETSHHGDGRFNRREISVWDLPGESEYQLVHRVFLDQAALGLVVQDARRAAIQESELRAWRDALLSRSPTAEILLVLTKMDAASPLITPCDIDQMCTTHGLHGHALTSAKFGEGIDELRAQLDASIQWETLPVSSVPTAWFEFWTFLTERQRREPLVATINELLLEFAALARVAPIERAADAVNLIWHAEIQGLAYRLPFGSMVLLRPELIDAYASAIVRAARSEPRGLGSVKESDVLSASIDLTGMERIDSDYERLVLHTVVELIVKADVALREGEYLVFPSLRKSSVDEPPPMTVAGATGFRFSGQGDAAYDTLVVRLSYSPAIELQAIGSRLARFVVAGGGELEIRFDDRAGPSRSHVSLSWTESLPSEWVEIAENLIYEHLRTHAPDGAVAVTRRLSCDRCGEHVVDHRAVEHRLSQDLGYVSCQYCDAHIRLWRFRSATGSASVRNAVLDLEYARRKSVNASITRAKEAVGEFDVFIAYHSVDREKVESLVDRLLESGIQPWVDYRCVPPGRTFQSEIEQAIGKIAAIAVILGPGGLGPWQELERQAAVAQFVDHGLPVIPIYLPGSTQLPPHHLLSQFSAIDLSEESPQQFERLLWSLRGPNQSRFAS